MNYLAEQTRHALAAEYVIGTMRGLARKRYQTLMMRYSEIRDTTYQWENHINALGAQLKPVAPDPVVWQKIVERLDAEHTEGNSNKVSTLQTSKPKPNLWKSWSVLATAAALVLAVLIVQPSLDVSTDSEQFTVVQDEDSKSLWLIEIYPDSIDVVATANLPKLANNDYQLWMVPKDGSAPISLGLLPQDGDVKLDKNPQFDQIDIAALAVSLEPLGGSPNGSPTQVLYIAELAIL